MGQCSLQTLQHLVSSGLGRLQAFHMLAVFHSKKRFPFVAFCFYLYFTQHPNFSTTGVVFLLIVPSWKKKNVFFPLQASNRDKSCLLFCSCVYISAFGLDVITEFTFFRLLLWSLTHRNALLAAEEELHPPPGNGARLGSAGVTVMMFRKTPDKTPAI